MRFWAATYGSAKISRNSVRKDGRWLVGGCVVIAVPRELEHPTSAPTRRQTALLRSDEKVPSIANRFSGQPDLSKADMHSLAREVAHLKGDACGHVPK